MLMRIFWSVFIFFATVFSDLAKCARVEHNWSIDSIWIDRTGNGARQALTVNGKTPIPIVKAFLNDTMVFNVHNNLNHPTTLHVHGYFFNGTSFLDGADMISSCTIAPGTNFTYEIQAVQAGTFWIHGHTHHENADGLRAPLLVYDPEEMLKSDEDAVLYFEDWYSKTFAERLAALTLPGESLANVNEVPDTLVNGISASNMYVLRFARDRIYRIRLLNMASTMWYEFSIDGHEMYVVELDGVLCKPSPVRSVHLAPAQRVSVLVKTHSRPKMDTQYKYRLRQYSPHAPSEQNNTAGVHFAGDIEYYQKHPIRQHLSKHAFEARDRDVGVEKHPGYLAEFNDFTFIPLHQESDEAQLRVPDRQIRVELGSGKSDDGQIHHYINGTAFANPRIPSIYTALTTGDLALDPKVYGKQTNAIVLHSFQVVELLIWNNSTLSHPMHLHGHVFQLIAYGSTRSNVELFRAGLRPMRRDTVAVGPFSYVVIRFQANNPGMWLFHCHIDTHHALGMAMLFAEAPEVLQLTPDMPEAISNQCLSQGIGISGNAAGNTGLDMSGLAQPIVRQL